MNKTLSAVAICILVGVGLILFFGLKNHTPASPEASTQSSATVVAPQQQPKPSPTSAIPSNAAPLASTAASVETVSAQSNLAARAGERVRDTNYNSTVPPEIAVQNVRRVVHQYGEMFGGDPVGTNPEITAALSGKNPKQINFLSAEAGMRVNENGELIDNWGTPYFFHQISGSEMEVHSAGPDKVMWTADDIVAR